MVAHAAADASTVATNSAENRWRLGMSTFL
jgi:hypothetical protein